MAMCLQNREPNAKPEFLGVDKIVTDRAMRIFVTALVEAIGDHDKDPYAAKDGPSSEAVVALENTG
jgi:hypothetical protein